MTTKPLHVAVVGGGIGGVTTALALRQRGIDVQLFEQAAALTEVGAGVALAPNGVRMLRRLGVGDAVDRWGSRWTDTAFCHADGTAVAPILPSAPDGRPIDYFGIHRADLLDLLVAGLPGEVVAVGHRCIGFEQAAERATVHFANGASFRADAVVAADGIHSVLQAFVVPPARPMHSGSSAYRGVIPCARVAWPIGKARLWMGEGKHFLVYPLRANQLLNYVGFVPTSEAMQESWSAPGDPEALAKAFAGWDATVSAIIAHIDTTFTWGLYDREPLPRWSNGRLTLLGDAAHPMLPHAGQGANQAIEDAVALATILARADRSTVPAALRVYETVRRQRTADVQRQARLSGARYDASSRDAVARDGHLQGQARSRAWLYDYDAQVEAAAAADAAGLAATR
jgi:salicylate hydroxylase